MSSMYPKEYNETITIKNSDFTTITSAAGLMALLKEKTKKSITAVIGPLGVNTLKIVLASSIVANIFMDRNDLKAIKISYTLKRGSKKTKIQAGHKFEYYSYSFPTDIKVVGIK